MKIIYHKAMDPKGSLISLTMPKILYSNFLYIENNNTKISLKLIPDEHNDPYNCSILSKEQLLILRNMIDEELLEIKL